MRRGGRHRTAPARTATVVLVAGALTLAGGAVAPPGVAAGEPVGTVSSWPVDPVPGIPGASSPRSIAAGPDGNLWFTLAGNASGAGIGRITPSGQVTTWAPIPGLAPYGVVDITSGPDGNLWFTTGKPGTVGRAKPDGTIDLLPVQSADGTVTETALYGALTTADDSHLWLVDTNPVVPKVVRIGCLAEVAVPDVVCVSEKVTIRKPGGSSDIDGLLAGLAVTGSGNQSRCLVVAVQRATEGLLGNSCSFQIGGGVNALLTSDPIGDPDPGDGVAPAPLDVAWGPDNHVWFTETGYARIGRAPYSVGPWSTSDQELFPLPAGAKPASIAAGPDGNVWVGQEKGAVGRITPQGAWTEFAAPGFTSVSDITAGPDGAMWFVGVGAGGAGRVGRVSTGVGVTPPAPPPPGPPPAGDTTAPTAQMSAPLDAVTFTAAFNVAWTSDDPNAVFRLQRATKRPNQPLGGYEPWGDTTTLRTVQQKAAKPGTSYCYRVQAFDAAGNTSPWSPPACTTLPVDDRSLSGKAGWQRPAADGHYRGTVSSSKTAGATLTSAKLHAERLAVVVTKRPGGGVIGVYVKGKRVGLVRTAAAKVAKQRTVPVSVRLTGRSVSLRVESPGKKGVLVDGLATLP